MKFLKVFLPITTIALMVIIFCFSAQPADDSTEVSNSIGYLIGRMFVKDFEQLDEARQLEFVNSADHTIRKLAHGTEYMLLGLLCTGTCLIWLIRLRRKNLWLPALISWIICVLYAVSDEVHQMFVPGRACMFTDVLVDAGGITVGVLLLTLICQKLTARRAASLL